MVNSVAISPDGLTVASGGFDGLARLWPIDGRGKPRELAGNRVSVNAVAFRPDGRALATGGHFGSLLLWDLGGPEPTSRELHGHQAQVFGVAFSPDGTALASASADRTVRLWDASTGEPGKVLRLAPDDDGEPQTPGARVLQGPNLMAWAVAFSPDGKRLASATAAGTVVIWDPAEGKPIRTLPAHAGPVRGVAISPDGRYLATCSQSTIDGSMPGEVKLWDAASFEAVASWTGPEGGFRWVAFSPDGLDLAAAAADGSVRVWDVPGRRLRVTHRGHADAVNSTAFTPDGRTLASGGADGSVRIWEALTEPEALSSTISGNSFALAPIPGGREILVERGGSLDRVDIETGKPIETLRDPRSEVVPNVGRLDLAAVSIQPGGKLAVTLAHSQDLPGVALIWDLERKEVVRRLNGHERPISSLAFNHDGSRLATGGLDARIKIWETRDWTEVADLAGHQFPVRDLAWSPDGKSLISAGSADQPMGMVPTRPQDLAGEVLLWDVGFGRSRALEGLPGAVNAVAFHPSEPLAAAGSSAGGVMFWEAAGGRPSRRCPGTSSPIRSLAFSPDGDRLAVAGDRVIHLFEVTTGQEVLALRGHRGTISDLAFIDDGTTLISGATAFLRPGELRIWQSRRPPSPTPPTTVEAEAEWHQQQLHRAHQAGSDFGAMVHIDALRRLRPGDADLAASRGISLSNRGRWDEAIAEYRAALAVQPDLHEIHYNLGNALRERGDLEGAAGSFRRAIELRPDLPEPHCNLGNVLVRLGRYGEGAEAIRKGHTLGMAAGNWRYPSARWLEEAEQLAALDARVSAYLEGGDAPDDVAGQLRFAYHCYQKGRYTASARLFASALKAEPGLGDDRGSQHRYNAACSAALAGSGADKGPPLPSDEAEREGLRRLAMGWLEAERSAWASLLGGQPSQGPSTIVPTLSHWAGDPDLAPIRDDEGLAKLTQEECREWSNLWERIGELRRRAAGEGPADRP